MNKVTYYLLLLAGAAVVIALPFLALWNPWSLMATVPVVLAWGTWVLNEYWQWVRSLGK